MARRRREQLGTRAAATGLAITDAQAAVTAGLGAVLGAVFGLLPAAGLVEAKARQIASEPGNMLAEQVTQFDAVAVPRRGGGGAAGAGGGSGRVHAVADRDAEAAGVR